MNRKKIFFFLLFLCFVPTVAIAELYSFVADAVQAAPGQETRRGKLYVSEIGTRFEFTAKKQKVIQIILPSRKLFRLLFPATKTYFELNTATTLLSKSRHAKKPCQASAQTICLQKPQVRSGKSRLEHWIIGDKAAKGRINVWWDPARHMYIKQIFPDGTQMLAQKTGSMQFEGRQVEQWRMTISFVNGARRYSYMLFAPDLGFPVMEQGSKGLVKELHNIKPYGEDAKLFDIPAGYKRIIPPTKRPK